MALLFAAGSTLAALLYSTSPSLSTLVLTSAGTTMLRWGLQKYISTSLGNYYYVYQLATGTTPDNLKAAAATASTGHSLLSTTGNIAYYGSKTAIGAISMSTKASIAAGSLLLITVTASGKVLYTVTSGAASAPAALFKYIAKQEPNASLDDFYEWNSVTVDIPHGDFSVDEEMHSLLSDWQLIEEKDEFIESQLLLDHSEEEETLEEISNWIMVEDECLFDSIEDPSCILEDLADPDSRNFVADYL